MFLFTLRNKKRTFWFFQKARFLLLKEPTISVLNATQSAYS